MFKKTLIAALALVATGAFAQTAATPTQFYVQGNLGKGKLSIDCGGSSSCSTSSSGNKLLVGYELGDGWAVELQNINYGKASATGSYFGIPMPEELKVSGWGVGVAYKGNFSPDWEYRLGLALNQNKLTDSVSPPGYSGYSLTTNKTAPSLSLGIGYKLNNNVSLLAEYDTSYANAKNWTASNSNLGGAMTYTEGTSTSSANPSLLSLGLRIKF